jgi:polyisoprenoid-binding protein YceI
MNQRWEIDSSHSSVHFVVRHMVISKVRGQFARWSGTIFSDESGAPERSRVEVTIDASSIDTGVADRDAHLKSPDFLDVATYPEIKFTANNVVKSSPERFRLIGQLTIRGVTKEVELDVEYTGRAKDPWGNLRAGFSAKTSIDRKEFGLKWNQALEAGGVLVADRVDIELEVEAVAQAATKVA